MARTEHSGKYKTAKDLEKAIQKYFEDCQPSPMMYEHEGEIRVATDKNGKPIIIENAATMAGLAYHLGYTSRQAIYDLENYSEEYSYLIKRARLKIESEHEERLCSKDKPTGSIFWLKNHGWHDKIEQEHSGGLTININDDI